MITLYLLKRREINIKLLDERAGNIQRNPNQGNITRKGRLFKMYEPTEEEKQRDEEKYKKEYESNHTKTYRIKNRGMDIKIDMMEGLYKQFKNLESVVDSQEGEERLRTLTVMAELGKAVIPD